MGKSRENSYKSHRGNNKHNRHRREDWKQDDQHPIIFQMPNDDEQEQEQDWRGRHAG